MKRVIEIDTKFYRFNQNNSGGYFEKNKKDGIAEDVFIEAISAEEARNKAKNLFDNYSDYCECCGERWSYYEDGTDEPLVCGKPVAEVIAEAIKKNSWFRKTAAIHHYDGKVEWIGLDPDKDE